jgi:hypothetical protein
MPITNASIGSDIVVVLKNYENEIIVEPKKEKEN